ncbi:protein ecdysoneless homolog [Nicotiana tabacum]|uniref:Protein ecdysoneless homolog n=2 Tax=Nicotiana TaxID=4085 RepID=A0A1S3YF10_TOBAC|nr:PREDICTED: protein SGT1 homolog At5g65490 [Nicotiana sylvestris]XP_016450592.1 PREDICTED: protein ecdysoneless homolog [Nicotiana tabacum]
MAELHPSTATSSNIFSQKNSGPPDDTVYFSIYPDFSLNPTSPPTTITSQLQSLHLQILQTLSPYTYSYIWQHEPFTLSLSATATLPHLSGKLRYGDNLEDEWFVVFLLFETSKHFPDVSIRVWDSDGEFLLIETAFHLPRWVNPDTATNRVFTRGGFLHIIPNSIIPSTPELREALVLLSNNIRSLQTRAPEGVQRQLENRLKEYPNRAEKNVHRVRVRVPVSVAKVLKHEPCLISLAVEGFYDRDIDTMKFAAKMDKFLERGSGEELVQVVVRMSRAMYAQLVQQTFQAPKRYPPLPPKSDLGAYLEAELGMKIACGFEMIYQLRKTQGMEGKGSTWDAFRQSLERSGYFEGLLPGSKEYKRLMQNAEEYYKNSSLHARESDMLSAPVRRIDEILALPESADDFKDQELPPSDDDSWLYDGEDELNAALQERQREMELYNSKKKQKSKEQDGPSNDSDNFDLKDISKSMQAFVTKVASYEGAEVPEDRNVKEVDFDVDRFMKDMESFVRRQGSGDTGNDVDIEEESSSDMEFDESEDENDITEPSDDEEGAAFMDSYSDSLNEELKGSTLSNTFVRAHEQSVKKYEGTSNATESMEEEFTPVDVDFNLVKNFLDSFSSQEGLPGPASNLLGLMGLQLPPPDASKGK